MAFIDTVSEERAEGAVAELYGKLRDHFGYVPNFGREFSHRPAVFGAWVQLNTTIRSPMDPRRYELATMAAAVQRRSSYCALAHGEALLGLGSSPDQVRTLVENPVDAGLDEVEQAIVEYAAKVASDPVSISRSDIERLRGLGMTDVEIFDVAAVAAARCFFTALGDALGILPDASYRERIPDLVDVLSVGRAVPRE